MTRTQVAQVACAMLVAGCASAVDAPDPPELVVGPRAPVVTATVTPTALDVTWRTGQPIVQAYVDGHGPLSFGLDSGASTYTLNERVANELKLELVDLTSDGKAVETNSGYGEMAHVRYAARIHELRAGPLVERDTGALVFDMSELEHVSGTRIDGLLPAAAFRGALLTIDCDHRSATVTAGELPRADGKDVLALAPWPVACISLEIGGKPRAVLVDTGSNGGLAVPSEWATSSRFLSPPTVVAMRVTLAGRSPIREGRLAETIAWGRHPIARPVVQISAGNVAIVGNELLREFRVTFDFSHQRVRFERSADIGPIRSGPVRGIGVGFSGSRDHAETWTVGYVLDDSPAAQAGIHVDDRVESIDGRQVSTWDFATWRTLVDSKDSVRLRVLGAGGSRLVNVPVKTFVE